MDFSINFLEKHFDGKKVQILHQYHCQLLNCRHNCILFTRHDFTIKLLGLLNQGETFTHKPTQTDFFLNSLDQSLKLETQSIRRKMWKISKTNLHVSKIFDPFEWNHSWWRSIFTVSEQEIQVFDDTRETSFYAGQISQPAPFSCLIVAY